MRTRKEIEWLIGESFDDAGDGHCFFHYATGVDKHGKTYTGVAVMVDDYLEVIEDIELVEEIA
jgi:hypothetical protein